MLDNKMKVLLVLSQEGHATIALKLPVRLQIVLRALIEVGFTGDNRAALLASLEGQTKAVRHKRSLAR